MNSLRERLSPAARASAGGARSSGSYVQGAMFNPRVLIALLNIYRVNYNFFEPRQYVAPWNVSNELDATAPGISFAKIPGTDEKIAVHKRRGRKPHHLTPEMRHGIQSTPDWQDTGANIMKILYQPWLYARTPLWKKFTNNRIDLRRKAPVAAARRSETRTSAHETPGSPF